MKNNTILKWENPLYTLNIGEFVELLDQRLGQIIKNGQSRQENPASTSRLVYGLRGIQQLFGCSHKTAQYYKDHIIQDAVLQNGRKIVVDADKALELFKKRGKSLFLFSRRPTAIHVVHGLLMLAVSRVEKIAESEAKPSLPSQPSLPSPMSLQPSASPQGQGIPEPTFAEPDGNDANDGIEGKERLYMPTFYQQVKEQLPPFLKKVAESGDSDADADMLVLGSLAVISACLPGIYGVYDKQETFPNLYLFVTAQAGSGKGKLNLCKSIVEPIHDEMAAKFEEDLVKFFEKLDDRDQNDKTGKRTVATRPKQRLVFLPANSSSTAIYSALSANEEQGLIFETEGDTLASSFGQDFGDFSDGLRKAFHHESISYLRRGDSEYVNIKKPRLSVVLSGTPQQVVRLMTSVENGLFSRFLFYCLDKEVRWIDVFDEGDGEPLECYYNKLGQQFLEFYHELQRKPRIKIILSPRQRETFNCSFERLLFDLNALFGEETKASVYRLGTSTFRIAMILTALRIMEDRHFSRQRFCRDDDFEIAMTISDRLQHHMLRVIKELPTSAKKTVHGNVMETVRYQAFWDSLPEEFDAQCFKTVAQKVGLSVPTAERYIRQWLKTRLDKIQRGQYRKHK